MKSIKRKFEEIKNNNHCYGDYYCFAEAIKHKGYTRRAIKESFEKLVEIRGYSKKELNEILGALVELSKKP